MRVLIVSPEIPDPEGNGGQIRIFHLTQSLASRGLDIAVIAPGNQDGIERGLALRDRGVEFRPVRRPTSQLREVLDALVARPILGVRLITRSWLAWQAEVFLSELREELAAAFNESWDAVVIEHDWAISWARVVPPDIPVGLTFHNITASILDQQSRNEGGLRSVRDRRDAWLSPREVDRYSPRVSMAFACSPQDRDGVEQRWGIDCAVVPNGVDLTTISPAGSRPELPGRILFTGTMAYRPNAQAAIWFAREVFDRIRSVQPDATFTVVGRDPPADVVALDSRPGVEVVGRVPDLGPWFEEAQVVVVPLLAGGGTKLKMIEAMAWSKPVVATPLGAEGIAGKDEAFLVAEGPADFAETTIRLLRDSDQARKLGDRGGEIVTESYSWDAAATEMERALNLWLGGSASAAKLS
jgi:glycosyltransferase involved in cell wall biosynthesis